MLFFLLAVWCYERAKQAGVGDRRLAQSWYTASAASFGLMMASKYLPHLYGLYLLANLATVRADAGSRPIRRRFFVAMGVAFVAANFGLLLPATWWNIVAYVQGETLTHHGHPYAGRLWVTDVPISALGVPPTFYLMFVLTRMPLVVLAGCAVGAIITLGRRREHGYGFLRVMLFFLAAGSSVMAAKFLRYSLPILVLLDLMAAVGIVAALNWLLAGRRREVRSVALSVACAALAVTLFTGQAQASPHFAMHRNLLARWLDADGRRFPEAGYDYGVREAVSMIAATAGPGAVIVSDVPSIVRFYLEGRGRTDIGIRSFSAHGLSPDATEQWVFVQDAHVYFETAELIAQLRRRHEPVETYALRGVSLLEVFRVPEP